MICIFHTIHRHMTETSQTEKRRLQKSTKSGWAIHEIGNALAPLYAWDFQVDSGDVQNGQRILRQFLQGMSQPNPNTDGQGALTDEEIREFLEEALGQEWTEANLKILYEKFLSLRNRVDF